MLKLIGICILLFTSILISRELVAARRHRLEVCEELLRFVCFLRVQIGCFLRPTADVVVNFSSDSLAACGFPSRGGALDPCRDFASSDVPRIVGKECSRIIESLLSSLGSGYLEDEMGLIDAHRAELSALVEGERAEAARQVRLIRTLTASATLGLVILII